MFGEKKQCFFGFKQCLARKNIVFQRRNNAWREKTMFEAKKDLKNQKSKERTYRVLFFALGR